MSGLPKLDTQCAQLAEMTFDRGRYELQAARARIEVDKAVAAQRSKGCRDRAGRPLTKPHPFLLVDRATVDTKVFARWLTMFRDMHNDHNARCVSCSKHVKTSERLCNAHRNVRNENATIATALARRNVRT